MRDRTLPVDHLYKFPNKRKTKNFSLVKDEAVSNTGFYKGQPSLCRRGLLYIFGTQARSVGCAR